MASQILIFHCGPMKTGSTAIQDLLTEQRDNLLKMGISYHHVRAKNLIQHVSRILDKEELTQSKIILLSSEFFSQVNPDLLKPILDPYQFQEKHAISVARPLRDLYPSLYLQNLKGSSMRTTSLNDFINLQIISDQHPETRRVGQIMNFQYLDNRLSELGFLTHWMMYNRQSLLHDFLNLISALSGISLLTIDRVHRRPPAGTSPRRSLRMEVSGIARLVNFLTKRSWLTSRQRELILTALLNLSDLLNRTFPRKQCLTTNTCKKCDLLDKKINHRFLISKGLPASSFISCN